MRGRESQLDLATLKGGLRDFEPVRNEVRLRHERNLPDEVVSLSSVEFLDADMVALPTGTTLHLTDWAKDQLGTEFGCRWGKWFEGMDPEDAREELQRRAKRSGGDKLVRARRWEKGDPRSEDSDGECRAFLGPRYAVLDDEHVFDALEGMGDMSEYCFSVRLNDRSSHIIAARRTPESMGPITDVTNAEVRHIYWFRSPGGDDIVYPGWRIRNSEVGATALALLDHILRLVCLNGMTSPFSKRRTEVLYKRHTSHDQEKFTQEVFAAFEELPEVMDMALKAYRIAKEHRLPKPIEVLTDFLARQKQSNRFIEAAISTWNSEPDPTTYGLIQAITATARDFHDDRRLDIEVMAGRLLSTVPH